MGKVQLFEIRLGESRVIYSPGEPLVGTVTVRLSGSLQYRGEPAACPAPAPRCPPRAPAGSGHGGAEGERPGAGWCLRSPRPAGGGVPGVPVLPARSRGWGCWRRGGAGWVPAVCPLCAGAAPLAPRPPAKLLCVFGGGWRGSNAKSLG